MKIQATAIVFSGFACIAPLHAQDPAPQRPAVAGYEQPYSFAASALLPNDLLSGPNFRVDNTVRNDGLNNNYRLITDEAAYDVKGTDMLRTRVAELQATEQLREVSKGGTFANAMASAGKAKLNQAGEVIADPIGAVKALPKGIGNMFSKVGKTVGSTGQNRGKSDGNTVENATGVARAKRALAASIGVDPYSSNKELQKALGEIAWAQVMGGLTMNIGTSLVLPPGVGLGLSAADMGMQAKREIVERTPEELRAQNRQALLGLGIPAATVNQFIINQNYSPTRQTIITHCLASIGSLPTLNIFLNLANSARDENGAFFYQRTIMLIAAYNYRTAPVRRFERIGPVVVCRDAADNIVVPVFRDYVLWTSRVAGAAEAIERARAEDANVRNIVILVSGDVSPRVRRECDALQFTLYTKAFSAVR